MEKFKILIIDDREENIYALRLTLEDNFDDIEIFEALSVDDGLLIIMKNNINLILSDVQMPDTDGFDLINYLKGVKQTKDIPIILISAIYNDSKYLKKGYDLGAVDYITKPIDDKVLSSKLKVFLDFYKEQIKKENELSEKDQLLINQMKVNRMIESLEKYDKKLKDYDTFLNESENDIDFEQLMRDKKRIDELMQ